MARRLSDEELQARQDKIDELERQIKELQAQRRKLKALQCSVYIHRRLYAKRTDRATGLSLELFGKRRKDLTPDELREYNRVSQQRWRERSLVD